MVKQSIKLDFIPGGIQDRLHASQYDTGERVFSFLCFYGSSLYEIPSGAVVTMNGQKPGGYTFVIPCTYDGSKVTCDCTASMTDVDGLVTCELEVVTNGEVVQSGNFYLVVEKAAIDSGAVPTSDFEAVSQMVADAAASAQAAEEAAASIDASTFVQKSEITRSTTQTTTGQKVVDAVELNKNVSGTLAKKISDNASAISALDTAVVKKVDLSTSGTVATQKQFAADAWQLNPDNEGSYAKSVDTQIADLAAKGSDSFKETVAASLPFTAPSSGFLLFCFKATSNDSWYYYCETTNIGYAGGWIPNFSGRSNTGYAETRSYPIKKGATIDVKASANCTLDRLIFIPTGMTN